MIGLTGRCVLGGNNIRQILDMVVGESSSYYLIPRSNQGGTMSEN